MNIRKIKSSLDSSIKSCWFIPNDSFEFISLPYQRSISSVHVNKIVNTLKGQSEPHFNEPLVVNIREKNKVVLLDGYHRWDALKKFNQKVKIKFETYTGLSKQEEKTIYEEYNIGKKHSVLDIVRPLLDEPGYKHLKKFIKECDIPLLVYANRKKGIPMTRLILWYKQQSVHKNKRISLGDYIKTEFNEEDVEKICDWSNWYVSQVGTYSGDSRFFKGSVMSVMMHIYFNTLRLDLFEKRLSKFKFDSQMIEYINTSTGFTGFRMLLPVIARSLNKGLVHKII